MLFNSFDFAIFLPIVFILYWFVCKRSIKAQNVLLVIASYVFYGWWDWRFLFLILFSTLVDYSIGLALAKESRQRKRKMLLAISVFVNIGLLGFFKYYNFFLDNFVQAFSFFGTNFEVSRLDIILPVGISFYTFQTLSYTIDVYRNKLEPTKDLVAFTAFVSFFPQLVAGPIERATNLLPQFFKKRKFNSDQAIIGFKQIIWGLFKKIVIADNCAQYVNEIFGNYDEVGSLTLILGAVYFAFQIYGDFSGYSDIAIGTARLFNFRLMTNFRYPYFSRDIAEFWRRWHISLSTWFRDYVYIPLGGSRGSQLFQVRNVFIIFLVSGFWHGANWTFIVWGAINALFFIPLLLTKRNRNNTDTVAEGRFLPNLKEFLTMLGTFGIVTLGWIYFRAESVTVANDYIAHILAFDFKMGMLNIERYPFELLPLLAILLYYEWFSRDLEFPLYSPTYSLPRVLVVVVLIATFGSFSTIQDFIYFQF
ncbi:MBOAT family protein [Rasiella rasia]|uniref:MBOAT family protein n=1 Tax=Rasiella rasia TaxID=2744027 RepID=A0A6G6GQ90_9FLAO|nr:MBOAT family protein [Rasiella rasia]QIE60630.1 MBOAT family protein [Rasiella rasia]